MRPRTMGACSCGTVQAGRVRRRGIGQSGGSFSFNATDYVPPELASDYNTARGYYQQFSAAAQGASFHNGALTLSPQTQQAIATSIETTVEVVVPVLGPAFAVFLALAPQAGAGPGVCMTDPPSSPGGIASWSHFTSWQSQFGMYALGAPGSFEAYANPILQGNWELFANCFSDKALPAPAMLAALVASWNATHQGPARTITRTGLNPPGFQSVPNFDPIADALQQAVIGKYIPANASSLEDVIQASAAAPTNVTSSFQVNSGPLIVHLIPLTLHPKPLPTAVRPAPLGSSSGPGLGTVAVLGVAGVATWAIATKGAAGALAWAKRLVRF